MGGGLMQLVAYGAQDIYLTGNPQITFFKVVYRRHTNFSMEAIEQTFSGTVADNGRATATVSRNGDLVHKMYLQHSTGATSSTAERQNPSAMLIDSVELEIGGQQIDKHYGKWMEAWVELTENKTGRAFGTNFQIMSGMCEGAIAVATTADAPAQHASDGETDVPFRKLDQTLVRIVYTPLQFWFCRNPGLALPLIALQYHEVKVIFNWGSIDQTNTDAKLWCDYIYLDTDERRRFAQVSHEYLIEQVQYESHPASNTATINFNHPVKELVITGAWAAGAFGNICGSYPTGFEDTLQLKLNGHDRFAARPLSYFTRTQVWENHSGEGGFIEASIAVYSFALKPEEHQPSGTCNFSRIDTAQLSFGATSAAFDIYAVNYNVLRIMSGMGGLAYSN
tara:strand:- start:169 stop:1350 length:1182 start_codon:yes stop_codon:yes gene_type:complete